MKIVAKAWSVLLIIILIPVYLILKIMKWAGLLVQMVAGWVFRTLGIIVLVTTIGCFMFQIESTAVLLRMLVSSAVVFLLPVIGDLMVAGVALLEGIIKLKMRYGE